MLKYLQAQDGAGLVHHSSIPQEMFTGTGAIPKPRFKVDQAQTSFFEGREFRSFFEFSLANGVAQVLKFVSPVDFILFGQDIGMDAGGLRMSAITGGVAGGTYNVTLPIIGKNRMAERPLPQYLAQATITTGGTVTGGTEVEVLRMAAGGGLLSAAATVGAGVSSERGLPAGTYFIKILGNTLTTTTGVYTLWWEERAAPSSQIIIP